MEINIKESIYQQIRCRIMGGSFQAGQRVSDLTISEELGVSRTPVREAISQLQSEGFLEHIPRFGTFVRKLDRDELSELFDIREALEGYAAGLAAKRISETSLDELEDICRQNRRLCEEARTTTEQGENADLYRRAVKLDLAFHRLIVEAAGNRYMTKAITDYKVLVNIMSLNRDSHLPLLHILAETYRGHLRITQALRRHDAQEAHRLAAMHVAFSKQEILQRYEIKDDENAVSHSAELQTMLAKMEKYFTP